MKERPQRLAVLDIHSGNEKSNEVLVG